METPSSSKLTTMIAVGFIFFIFAFGLVSDVIDFRDGQISPIAIILKGIFALACLAAIYQLFKNYRKSLEEEKEEIKKFKIEQQERHNLLSEAQNLAKDKPVELTYLGGSGIALKKQAAALMFLHASNVLLIDNESLDKISFDFNDITNVEVSGPGTETSNAGLIGGGFGIAGFIQGAAVAAVVNSLTTTNKTNTFLRILGNSMEAYFHTGMMDPGQLKLVLSPLVVSIERRKRELIQPPSSTSMADEIVKLSLLEAKGVITPEEFASGKKRLLEG